MKILVIGGTGGTGRALIDQALQGGYQVTALVRNPDKMKVKNANLNIVKGNVLDALSLDLVMPGHDAVICVLGHKQWFIKTTILSRGTKNIIDSMEKYGVKRLICQTSLGIADSKFKLGLYYTLFVEPVIVYFYFRDKEKQEALIKSSNLEWTIVRPTELTNGRLRKTYKHGIHLGNYLLTRHISRKDAAHFLLQQLTSNQYVNKTPALHY